ncbi:MAG: hypothetical protein ABFC96_18570 [Thermoguttaceae bacterium]
MKATWKWRVVAIVVLVGAAWLLHAPLFRAVARPLIVEQASNDFNYIGIITGVYGPDGDRCYDVATTLAGENGHCRLLLIGAGKSRLTEVGALPPFGQSEQSLLARRGVPASAIVTVSGNGDSDWSVSQTLGVWLRDHRDARVLLLCSAFHSAHLRDALDAALAPSQSARVWIRPLRDRRFNETNWWQCRAGFRQFGIAWLIRLQGWLGGGRVVQPEQASADHYERDFRDMRRSLGLGS